MAHFIQTSADLEIRDCINTNRSFALIAGAGSGKTASLITALGEIRKQRGKQLRQNGQRIACVTYTKRAAEVIRSRLGFDDLYFISTLHSFLWGEIGRFQSDIREALQSWRIPNLIAKARDKDSGRETIEARRARNQIAQLEETLKKIEQVPAFKYSDSKFSDYLEGKISHDDIIEIAGYFMAERAKFGRLLGSRFPIVFIDEAQDTFGCIIEGLNAINRINNSPLIGYFGDPWQQIYEGRAGDFSPPDAGKIITKTENFRCSPPVVGLLNAFRNDVQQVSTGEGKELAGSVAFHLVRAEEPEAPRRRYSEPQLDRALEAMDAALELWGWTGRDDVIRLFLVRQMIARRLGFSELHQIFTGDFASSRAQEDYESGEHFLLRPFVHTIWPLITAHRKNENRAIIDILRTNSPGFRINGPNSEKTLGKMIDLANHQLESLAHIWETGTAKQILVYCRDLQLLEISDRLEEHLARNPRNEVFDEELYSQDKGDWLADTFFSLKASELAAYCDFARENSAYSTQHGVKGEQYRNVLVVYDDVEAAWNQFSFTKLLTPETAGTATPSQLDRGRKLAYVCFSRAMENLKVILFTPNPETAKAELINKLNLTPNQISVA